MMSTTAVSAVRRPFCTVTVHGIRANYWEEQARRTVDDLVQDLVTSLEPALVLAQVVGEGKCNDNVRDGGGQEPKNDSNFHVDELGESCQGSSSVACSNSTT